MVATMSLLLESLSPRALIVEHATRIAGLRAGTIDFIGHPGSTQIFDINQSLSLQRTNPEIDQYRWSQRSDNCAA